MSDRVSVAFGPDGTATVLIRSTTYRRIADTAKATSLGLILSLAAIFIRFNRPGSPSEGLGLAVLLAIGMGVYAYLRSGERVVISPESVRVDSALDSVLVSRAQQSVPTYSHVDPRIWMAQRWGSERGSGVLLFGTRDRGLRFGVDLDGTDAARILKVFDRVPASGVAPRAGVSRTLRVLSWTVAPLAGAFAFAIFTMLGAGSAVATGAAFAAILGAALVVARYVDVGPDFLPLDGPA